MLSLQTYKPARLSRFIKSFWRLNVPGTGRNWYEEDILPDGHHEIIFHLNTNSAKRKSENEDWMNEPGLKLKAIDTVSSETLLFRPDMSYFPSN